MRIIVSASGEDMTSPVDQRFGRCSNFVVVEVEGDKIMRSEAFENKGSVQGHGAGIAAAQQVADLKPDKIITGNLGPNAWSVVNQLGIEVYSASGTVKDAVLNLIHGRLSRIGLPVEKHFGTV